jgi:quercetin dioxygenase-like cupin family protein
MERKPAGPTAKAPAEHFTGDAYVDMLKLPDEPSRLVVGLVRFAPGARTNWHSHALGQTLYCTDGVGLVVNREGTVIELRPGDTVWTPPGEEHWHGATDGNMMCHLAMAEVTGHNDTVWLEPVTDDQLGSAVQAAAASSARTDS